METTKKWYQSKIVLIALLAAFFFASNLAFGWLQPKFTPEQLTAVEQAVPALGAAIRQGIESGNYINAIGAVVSVVLALIRVFGTSKRIA